MIKNSSLHSIWVLSSHAVERLLSSGFDEALANLILEVSIIPSIVLIYWSSIFFLFLDTQQIRMSLTIIVLPRVRNYNILKHLPKSSLQFFLPGQVIDFYEPQVLVCNRGSPIASNSVSPKNETYNRLTAGDEEEPRDQVGQQRCGMLVWRGQSVFGGSAAVTLCNRTLPCTRPFLGPNKEAGETHH